MTQKLHTLDSYQDGTCCECGCPIWIVDAATSKGPFWLLCLDTNNVGCVNTRDLPADVEVVKEDDNATRD